MTDTPRNVIRVLRKIGFKEVRSTGSHRIFERGGVIIPVSYHPGDLNTKTFHRILKAGRAKCGRIPGAALKFSS